MIDTLGIADVPESGYRSCEWFLILFDEEKRSNDVEGLLLKGMSGLLAADSKLRKDVNSASTYPRVRGSAADCSLVKNLLTG